MRKHEVQNTLTAGVFVAILLIISMSIIFFLGKESALFERKMIIRAKFDDASNLRLGAQVKLKGIKIGHVADIYFETIEDIVVHMDVIAKYSKLIKKDSEASIKTQGMLGDKYVEIFGGSSEAEKVKENDYLNVAKDVGIKEFIDQSEDILSTSLKVLNKVDNILEQMGKDQNIYSIVKSTKLVSENLTKITNNIDGKKVKRIINNLDKLSNRINEGPGTLHSLLYDQSAYQDIRTLLGGAQRNKILKYFIRESIKNYEKVEQKN